MEHKVTGILHAHSTYSYDGKCTLRELKGLAQAAGHAFVCITEHTDELTKERHSAMVAECRALSDESFVFVPGLELPYRRAHILLFGCTDWVGQTADSAAALWAAAESAALTVLAHPVRNRFVVDPDMLSVLDGVEVWNQQYDGKAAPRARAVGLLERLRRERSELLAMAGVDFHRPEHLGSPTVTLFVTELSEPAILTALGQGAYTFATHHATAPLQLAVGERLRSRCSILLITAGKRVNALLAAGGLSLPRSWRQQIRSWL